MDPAIDSLGVLVKDKLDEAKKELDGLDRLHRRSIIVGTILSVLAGMTVMSSGYWVYQKSNRLELYVEETEQCHPRVTLYNGFKPVYSTCGFEAGLEEIMMAEYIKNQN